MKIVMVSFLFVTGSKTSYAQLFPGLTGETLVEALRNEFTPAHLLNDTQVKDTLYAKVFIEQDSVHCIYSGLSRHLPSGVDPSQWLYGTGLEVGSINLEHSWPQAKGAGEGTMGNMNMYHLFPSRSGINSDRGDSPYGEINDMQTTRWYFRDKEMATKPSSNIAAYSEYINSKFEPRESVKGDIARAMFYFWTIYRADALAADPNYFDTQVEQLCLWHQQDPVDAFELARNARIAPYQDGKQNPFIIDCSLVMRAYCSQLPECMPVAAHDVLKPAFTIQYLSDTDLLFINGDQDARWQLLIVDEVGRVLHEEQLFTNQFSEPVSLNSGIYFAFAVSGDQVINIRFFAR